MHHIAVARTISICQGKGSLGHNNRAFHTKNTDPARTKDNIVFVREPIGEAYEKAVDRYNAKQKRSDRRINDGYFAYQFGQPVTETKLTSPDKRKSFYECLIQLGTMEDTGVGTPDGEAATACLCEYMKGFAKRNPNFHVFNAVIHLDEKTPHLHIDYIPVGHYKRGVDTQNGIAQALKEMGYGTGKNAIAEWRQTEYLVFREICERQGFTISEPKKSRGVSFTVQEYKDIQQEKQRLTEELQPLREMELAAEETVIIGKKKFFSDKVTISSEELEQLERQKKAVAVQSIDNQHEYDLIEQEKLRLDEREAEITAMEVKSLACLEERSKELDAREEKAAEAESLARHKLNEASDNLIKAEDTFAEAKNKLFEADCRYNEQIELNQRYNDLRTAIRSVEADNDSKSYEINKLRSAAGISDNVSVFDAVSTIKAIVSENAAIHNELEKELYAPSADTTNGSAIEKLHEAFDRYKRRITEQNDEIKEKNSLIAKLGNQVSTIKNAFIKTVLAVNTLLCSERYGEGLTGLSRALVNGITLFTDNFFRSIGEYDSIDKWGLDEEIEENTEIFIEPETIRTNEREI